MRGCTNGNRSRCDFQDEEKGGDDGGEGGEGCGNGQEER
jgi:hypothetical protein